MINKTMAMIMTLVVVLSASAMNVAAADCVGLDLYQLTPDPEANEPFNVGLASTVGDPLDPFGDYTEATLTAAPLGAGSVTFITPRNADLTSLVEAVYVWSLSADSIGGYRIDGLVTDSGGEVCTLLPINVSVGDVPLIPDLDVEIVSVSDALVSQMFTITTNLTNVGNGNATNVSVSLDMVGGNSIESPVYSVIEAGSTEVTELGVTTSRCAIYRAIVLAEYFDVDGEEQPTVSDSVVFFVEGSDFVVDSMAVSNGAPNSGETINITTEMTNVGTRTANATLAFYLDSPENAIETTTLEDVEPNERVSVTLQWSATAPQGNHTIFAKVASSLPECNPVNNEDSIDIVIISGGTSPPEEQPPGNGDSGGTYYGGGGGGGGPSPASCYVRWECSAWNPCDGGTKTRTCTYRGTCPMDQANGLKPVETGECLVHVPTPVEPQPPIINDTGVVPVNDTDQRPTGITGLLIQNSRLVIGVLVVAIVLAAIYIALRRI